MGKLAWGGTAEAGFTAVSSAFLKNYRKLGVSFQEAMFVIHVLDYQWTADGNPHPKLEVLAEQTGLGARTLSGYVRNLRRKGLLVTKKRVRCQEYDFSPLMQKLNEFCGGNKKEHAEKKEAEIVEEVVAVEVPKVVQLLDEEDFRAPDLPLPSQVDMTYRKTTGLDLQENDTSIETDEEKLTSVRFAHTEGPRIGASQASAVEENGRAALQATIDRAIGVAMTAEKRRKPMTAGKQRAYKRMRRFKQKKASRYNANDMELVLAEVWTLKWPNTPSPKFTNKDRAHAKALIDHYGAAITAHVVRTVVTQWSMFKSKLQINGGYPSIAMLYGYRNSVFPMVLEQEEDAKPGWGTHFSVEDGSDNLEGTGWGG